MRRQPAERQPAEKIREEDVVATTRKDGPGGGGLWVPGIWSGNSLGGQITGESEAALSFSVVHLDVGFSASF